MSRRVRGPVPSARTQSPRTAHRKRARRETVTGSRIQRVDPLADVRPANLLPFLDSPADGMDVERRLWRYAASSCGNGASRDAAIRTGAVVSRTERAASGSASS